MINMIYEEKINVWKVTSDSDKTVMVYANNREDVISLGSQIYGKDITVKKTGESIMKVY